MDEKCSFCWKPLKRGEHRICRRCGNVFEERYLKPHKIPTSDEGFVEHRYCPSCRWAQKRAARLCDPRYVGVGGHGDVLEAGR